MDAVMQFLTQAVIIAILVGFFALMVVASAAILWFGYHVLHDHWTVAQTWKQAQLKFFHR